MKKICLFAMSALLYVTSIAQVTALEKIIALDLVKNNVSRIGIKSADVDNSIISGTYIIPGTDIRMVYLQQSYKDIPVYNHLHVLAFRNGNAVSVAGDRIASVETKVNAGDGVPQVDPSRAVKTALGELKSQTAEMIVPVSIHSDGKKFEFGSLGVSSENINAELVWYPDENKTSLKLVWQVYVSPLNSPYYWIVRINALDNSVVNTQNMTISCDWGNGKHSDHSNHKHTFNKLAGDKNYVLSRVISNDWKYRTDVVNSVTYNVSRWPAESPQHTGGIPVTHTDPWTMSPGNATTLGWHYDGTVYYDSLRGNNAFAYEDQDANNSPGYSVLSSSAQPTLTFNHVPDFTQEPIIRTPAVPNQQYQTINLFYWNNLIHDISYLYGFTETARNYQANNLGRGGVQGDYVLAEAQDGSGTNNANFSPASDGTRGRMQMYLWTAPTPDRDGDSDNGIILHEYGHGISNRMTGTGSGCLGNLEQMGEGWSDYFGLMLTQNWATSVLGDGYNSPRGIGTYALNQPVTGLGIRQYRYTTNMTVNPITYGNLPTVAVPHGVGTIWCTILWDMTWNLIQQKGISPNIFDPTATGGNVVAFKLVMEGMRLQPCSPGFVDGRNAILKADTLFYGAQHSCAIIDAFARRGIGIGASQGSSNTRGDEVLSFTSNSPGITAQPQNASICAGTNTSFSVTATGSGLTYQWQLSTNGGSTFADVTNGAVYSGATTSTLTITGATISFNGYFYRCNISNGCVTYTNPASITVVSGLVLNPSAATLCAGTIQQLTIAYGGGGGPTGGTGTWSPTTELYTDAAATIAYTGTAVNSVYCKPTASRTYTVTPSAGACSATPASVIITANPTPTVSAPTVTQPACPTPATGTIVVNASGSGTIEYSLNGGAYQLSNAFSGLAAGNYNITTRLQSSPSCVVSYSGNPVTINPQNASTVTTSYTGPAVAIPDNVAAGVDITLPVSSSGTINDLNFRFDLQAGGTCNTTVPNTGVALDHTYIGDLVFKLTSPLGTSVTFMNMRGGTGQNICQLLLDDDGGFNSITGIGTAGAFTGNWAPESPFSAFDGQNANGNWILNVSDRGAIDVGNLRRFSLIITASLPCATTPANDDAPGAFVVTVGTACTGSPYTNDLATQSASEPFAACKGTAGYRTVWYKFTAPASGAVKISTDYTGGTMGSDSRVALFSATDVNNYATFTPIACDDDNGVTVTDRSILYAAGLTAGNTYYIQVDGKDAPTPTGTFCLTVHELASSMLTSTSACAANQNLAVVNNNYTGWLSLCDATGNLVALINNPAGSVSTSTFTSGQNINAGPTRQDAVSGQYYLNRNFNISNASVSNINIRFFFLNSELTSLQSSDGGVTLSNLQVTRQAGTVCQNDFVAVNGTNSSLPQTANIAGTGYSWVQVTTPGLSNFYLHTSKAFCPVKTFLQGAYSSMNSSHKDMASTWAAILNANALSQPYTNAPYNYLVPESVSAGFFTSTAAITDPVDWVLLELRDATIPATLISRRSAIIREDGRIVDLNGTSDVSFRNLTPGNYFLVIRHRNHLDIRSSIVQTIDGTLGLVTPALYDFSSAQSKAYQDGAITTNPAQKDFGGGVFGMYGGNPNNNSTVRASGPLAQNDYLFLITTTLGGDITNIQSNVYNNADMNIDGTVRASGPLAINDYSFLITTVLGGDVTKIITQHQ